VLQLQFHSSIDVLFNVGVDFFGSVCNAFRFVVVELDSGGSFELYTVNGDYQCSNLGAKLNK